MENAIGYAFYVAALVLGVCTHLWLGWQWYFLVAGLFLIGFLLVRKNKSNELVDVVVDVVGDLLD